MNVAQHPRAIGFDPISGCVITRSLEHQVKLYSFKGELLTQQETAPPRNLPEQFVVSPQGHDVLAVYSRFVQYIRLPEREKKYKEELLRAPGRVQVCKLADIHDNLLDSPGFPPDRRAKTLRRSREYLEVLTHPDERVRRAYAVVERVLNEFDPRVV